MIERLLPRQADKSFEGHRAALWLLGLFIGFKLVMSVNSILNTQSVAVGADGFALDSFGSNGARAVLMLFALTALGQLMLALVALLALVRYRTLVPLVYALLILEHVARRLIVQGYAVERAATGVPVGTIFFVGFLVVLGLGLALSLLPRRNPAD
jgi:hypothetical protein